MRTYIHNFKPVITLLSMVAAVLITLIMLTAGIACGQGASAEPASTVPNERKVTAAVDGKNSLIVNIEGSVEAPGQVMVKYWSPGIIPLITQLVPTDGNAFSLQVMRLRAETRYDFKVFLVKPTNAPVLQHQGTFTTGSLPAGLYDARFQLIEGRPTYGLTLLDFNDTDFSGIVAIDQDAKVVWYYQHNTLVFTMAQRANRNLVFNELGDAKGWTFNEITPDGSKVRSVNDILENGALCQPHGRWHHEVLLRPGNKVWTLGSEVRSIKIDGQDRLQIGDTIEEWDIEKGTMTRLRSLFDLMDPAKVRTIASNTIEGVYWRGCNNEYDDKAEDWTHSNSLDILSDGKILVSARHLNQLIAIEPDLSKIAWRLGGPGSDFTFLNPSDRFWHQHSARELPNGNILLFDNGNTRPEEDGGEYSRALEIKLDWDKMEASKVWEYSHKPNLYSFCCSSAVRLENGNTVLVYGRDDNHDPRINTLVEADHDGKAVAVTEISSVGKTIQYRAVPVDTINGEMRGSVLLER